MKEDDQNAKEFFYDVSGFDLKLSYEEACKIESPVKAKAQLNLLTLSYIANCENIPYNEAEKIIKKKIGYYAGYYGNDVRLRVEKLYDTEHPIFGKISEMGIPTGEESYQCGFRDITLKVLRSERNSITELEKQLKKVEDSNKAAWEMYGSELCAGSMVKEEQELRKQIDNLKKKQK